MQHHSRRRIARAIAMQLLAGESQTTVVRRLAAYLVDTRQTDQLDRYVSDIEYECAQRGHLVADVVTARPLDTELQTAVRACIARKSGGLAELRERVETAVLGGMIISTPLWRLDDTLAARLKRLKIANQGD
jgi:F-type H+-transporting ATPase subunit delta